MSDFILDDTTLNFPKTNVRPVPANTQGVLTADDWGLACQAAYDIRNAIKRGKYHGWTAQASDPVPAGLDRYIWVRTDDQVLLVSSNGTSLAAVGKVTAKGDLLVFDGTKFRVLSVGTGGTVLTADAGEATGVKWQAPITSVGGDLSGSLPNPTVAKLNGLAPTTSTHGGSGNAGKPLVLDPDGKADGVDLTTTLTSASVVGGDLSGTVASPTVAKLQGRAVHSGAPVNGEVLTWVTANNRWEAAAASAGASAGFATYNGRVTGVQDGAWHTVVSVPDGNGPPAFFGTYDVTLAFRRDNFGGGGGSFLLYVNGGFLVLGGNGMMSVAAVGTDATHAIQAVSGAPGYVDIQVLMDDIAPIDAQITAVLSAKSSAVF